MPYYRYSELSKGILLAVAVVLCGFQTLLWGVAVCITIPAFFRDPLHLLMSIELWAIVVGGGYGLGTLGLLTVMIERYAAYGIPIYVRIGVIVGAMLAMVLLVDIGLKNNRGFRDFFFPLGPITLLLICLFLISRLRKKHLLIMNGYETLLSSKKAE